jgi:hypothetical protein
MSTNICKPCTWWLNGDGSCQNPVTRQCYPFIQGTFYCELGLKECLDFADDGSTWATHPGSGDYSENVPSPTPLSTSPQSYCRDCWGATSGHCRQANGVCWDYLPNTGLCPAGVDE